MSSRSDLLQRLGPLVLFILVIGASALIYSGITPLFGASPTPVSVSRPVDAAMALLNRARGPLDQATLCEPLKAYAPDLVPLGKGGDSVADAPSRPVILCPKTAADFPQALARSRRDGLGWRRLIARTDVVAFAADEGGFKRAMARSGLAIPAQDLRAFSPMLQALRSSAPGVVADDATWRIPAHADDGMVLYGPYLDLAAGAYRLKLHARMQGSPAECRGALQSFKPQVAVTQDTGRGGVHAKAPAAVIPDATDPCGVIVQDDFTIGAGGAKTVETPLYGATALPMIVDRYALEPVAAQAR